MRECVSTLQQCKDKYKWNVFYKKAICCFGKKNIGIRQIDGNNDVEIMIHRGDQVYQIVTFNTKNDSVLVSMVLSISKGVNEDEFHRFLKKKFTSKYKCKYKYIKECSKCIIMSSFSSLLEVEEYIEFCDFKFKVVSEMQSLYNKKIKKVSEYIVKILQALAYHKVKIIILTLMLLWFVDSFPMKILISFILLCVIYHEETIRVFSKEESKKNSITLTDVWRDFERLCNGYRDM